VKSNGHQSKIPPCPAKGAECSTYQHHPQLPQGNANTTCGNTYSTDCQPSEKTCKPASRRTTAYSTNTRQNTLGSGACQVGKHTAKGKDGQTDNPLVN